MSSTILRAILPYILLFTFLSQGLSQSLPDDDSVASAIGVLPTSAAIAAASTAPSTAPSPTSSLQSSQSSSSSPVGSSGAPPDVVLDVPELSVGRIELNVDNLKADINLNAKVASLVQLNAGVFVSIEKVNLTIVDVDAQLQLIVRLGNLVDIVNRVFESLDLNPLLMTTLDTVSDVLKPVVGAVDGLLGSVTRGGSKLSFVVDNLGNIVQQVAGGDGGNPVSSIVGNYLNNMTDTGVSETLQNGLTQKTFSYSPLNALVDIVFDKDGNVVQATVNKDGGSGSGGSGSGSGNSTAPSGDLGGATSGVIPSGVDPTGAVTSGGLGGAVPSGIGGAVSSGLGGVLPSGGLGDALPSGGLSDVLG